MAGAGRDASQCQHHEPGAGDAGRSCGLAGARQASAGRAGRAGRLAAFLLFLNGVNSRWQIAAQKLIGAQRIGKLGGDTVTIVVA